MQRELASSPRLLARPRITERLLAATSYPMSMIVAPAGFGKTTAISDLLEQRRSSSVLVSTPNDGSIEKFIQSFAHAFAPHFPDMATPPSESNAGAQTPGSNIDLYVAWANTHLRDKVFTVAVDDLQRADHDSSIAAFLSRLADRTRDHLTWVFSSRTNGHLPLNRWQAYGLLRRADQRRFPADDPG